MTGPQEQDAAVGRSWIVLVVATIAGFVAAGTIATGPVMGIILVLSLFIATFVGVLAHSILAEDPPATPTEQQREEIPDTIQSV